MMATPTATHPHDLTATATAEERPYYNISQAATLLGVSRVSIWRWIRDGELEVARLGHRTARIKREDLEGVLLRLGSRGVARGRFKSRNGPAESSSPDWDELYSSGHFVQFYERDAFLIDAVAEFVGKALRSGDTGIVVATAAHRAALDEHLRADGLDLTAARASGAYVPLDATEVLSTFMVDGTPDGDRFVQVVGDLLARAADGGRRVRIFGEWWRCSRRTATMPPPSVWKSSGTN